MQWPLKCHKVSLRRIKKKKVKNRRSSRFCWDSLIMCVCVSVFLCKDANDRTSLTLAAAFESVR